MTDSASMTDTRLILSLSLQDIDNLIKDLKPTQRMYRFASLLRHALQRTDGSGRCLAFGTQQGMELQPQYCHSFPQGTGVGRTRQGYDRQRFIRH